jgi:hypothetical protein
MCGDIVQHRLKTLLDPGEDQRNAPAALAKQRGRGKPYVVAAAPWRAAFDDAPGARKTTRIGVDDGEPAWSARGRTLHVIAFEEQLVVDRELRAKFLRTAGGKKE